MDTQNALGIALKVIGEKMIVNVDVRRQETGKRKQDEKRKKKLNDKLTNKAFVNLTTKGDGMDSDYIYGGAHGVGEPGLTVNQMAMRPE